MQAFRALRIYDSAAGIEARFEMLSLADLSAGEVVVRVRYSTINYKDALAATGAGRILRRYPLVGGIDLAGEVVSSTDARFVAGDAVLVTGAGLSETRDGGYAQYARLEAEAVVPLPAGIGLDDAMRLGTAGYTAALAIHRLEQNGQTPAQGPIVVTGATGGVGSIAIDMLAGRGYEVVAVSGKADADDYLRALGATRILRRAEIDLGRRPLETPCWAGAIDNLGGELLSWLMRTTDFHGNIASVGLAASPTLQTTVLPLILRGVSLLGIHSVVNSRALRLAVWQRIATDLKPRHLARIGARTIEFDALPGAFADYIAGTVRGRTLVRIG